MLIGTGINSDLVSESIELGKEIQKQMTRKSEKRKIHLSFINTILGTGLADMPILRKFNKEFQF